MTNRKLRSTDLGAGQSREAKALNYLDESGETSVRELYDALRASDTSLTESGVASLLWRLSEQGKISLEDMSPSTRSFTQFLALWERHLALYGSLGVALLAILSIYLVPSDLPWVAFRWFFVSAFALFTPGYVTANILFPRITELGSVERFVFSVGLSLVILMFVGLLLNLTSWGLTLTPIVISLTIFDIGFVSLALVVGYHSSRT